MRIVNNIFYILSIPRILKRLVVIIAVLFIFSKSNQQEENHKYYCFISFISVILWFIYDAYRCNEEDIKNKLNHEKAVNILKVSSKVMDLVCNFDPIQTNSIKKFQPIIKGSKCLFAKSSKIWGNANYIDDKDSGVKETLESNVKRTVPMLLQMLLRGENESIDGFLFEIRGNKSSEESEHNKNDDINTFADSVRIVLETISDLDPDHNNSARKSYIKDKAWHFTFNSIPIFVTTFSGCYDKSSSRYAYGACNDTDGNCNAATSGFVLLQPEYSFLKHDIPSDTPFTQYENPITIRDRIRKSFKDAGQEYYIPNTVHYPASEHIVKSLDGNSIIKWWEKEGRGKTKSTLSCTHHTHI